MKSTLLVLIMLLILAAPILSQTASPVGISESDREGLIALFKSTQGANWKHKENWLGPKGSECSWYGVVCSNSTQIGRENLRIVDALNLADNFLSGTLPNEIGQLRDLRKLDLQDNDLSGILPTSLLLKSDLGQLVVQPSRLTHGVDEIEIAYENVSVACSKKSIKAIPDGRIYLKETRCRESKSKTPPQYCVFRSGRSADFDALARYLVRNNIITKSVMDGLYRGSDLGTIKITARLGSERITRIVPTDNPVTIGWSLSLIFDGTISRAAWGNEPLERACSEASWK